MRCVVFILFMMLLSAPAFAQAPDHNTGNTFLADCQIALGDKGAEDFRAGYCLGYLEGLNAGENLKLLPPPDVSRTAYGPQWKQWCTPDGVTLGQLARVVVKYLADHPERLHEEKLLLVRQAFEVAWPCFR